VAGKDLLALSDDDYLDSLKATKLQMRKIRQALAELEGSRVETVLAVPSASPSDEGFAPPAASSTTPVLPSLYGLPTAAAPVGEASQAVAGVPVTTQTPSSQPPQAQAPVTSYGIPPPLAQQPAYGQPYGQPAPMPPYGGVPAGYPGSPGMAPQVPQYYPPPNFTPGVYNAQPQGCILL